MQALVKTAPGVGHLAVMDVPQPRPGPGEALVRIRRSGLCRTDLLVCRNCGNTRSGPNRHRQGDALGGFAALRAREAVKVMFEVAR